MLCLLAVAVIAGGGLYYITRPQRLAGLIVAAIEDFSDVQARVDSAHLSLTGQLTVEGLRLTLPDWTQRPDQATASAASTPGDAERLFEVDRVVIDPSYLALLTGDLAADAIALERPSVHLVEDLRTGRFNIQNLATGGDDQDDIPRSLPQVTIRDGRIQMAQVDAGQLQPLGALRIDGDLVASRTQPGVYELIVRQRVIDDAENATGAPGGAAPGEAAKVAPVLRATMRLVGGFQTHVILEDFSIEAPHRNLLPHGLRQWWDQLAPQGSLPTVEVAYDSDPAVGLEAVIALEHGALTLPYGDFAPSMTDVSGRFIARGEAITIEHLTGKVAGIGYAIQGQIDGYEMDAPFHLSARTDAFTIEQNPHYLSLLPPEIRDHYARFDPSGRFAAEIDLRRSQRGGEIRYSGELTVINARGRYHKFPFPLHDVTGAIRFSEQKVEIENLRGLGPNGGELRIAGVITPPGDGAAVDMRIVASDIPVDEHLLGAMKEKHRKVVDKFLSRDQYLRLLRLGLVRSSDPRLQALAPPHAETAPLFDLGGVVSATVEIHREFGDDRDYLVTTTIDTTGAGMLSEHWPYPLISDGGTLTIAPGAVTLDRIQARGLTGGSGIIDGAIDRPAKDDLVPSVDLEQVRLPIDELLLASLPDPQDQWVRDLRLAGAIAGDGRVFENQRGKIDFRLAAEFTDASADPFHSVDTETDAASDGPGKTAAPTRLADLTGSFTVSRSTLTLQRIAGRNETTALAVDGALDWSTDPVDVTLRLSAQGLELGRNLLAVLPADHPARARLDGLLETYQPTSRFDAELDYQGQTAQRAEDFTLTVKPIDLALTWRGERLAFDDIAGTIVARPEAVDVDLAVRMDDARATLVGRRAYGKDAAAKDWAFRLSATGDGLDPRARILMPDGLVTVIDRLAIDGEYDMTASLVGRDGQVIFDGRVALTDVVADVGVPITRLDGDLTVTAVMAPGRDRPSLDIRLDARRLRAADRLIEPFTLHLQTSEESAQVLRLVEMRGTVYHGQLVGEGSLRLGDPGQYQLEFTVNNADLPPMIAPPPPPDAPPDGAVPSGSGPDESSRGRGRISASLAIAGTPGRPDTRSGRGAVEIRDAELFDRPLTMAVLHAANLSLPTHRAFDRASASYLVDGDTIRFDALRFESPAVAIVGAGAMDFPTRRLDLALVSRNPGAPHLGAISDLLYVFKDELLAIHVTGTLDDPRARLVPFEGLRDSWSRIFGDSAPRATAADGASGNQP